MNERATALAMTRKTPVKRILRLAFDVAVWICCVVACLLYPVRLLRKALTSSRLNSLWAGTPIVTLPIKCKAERLLGVNARTLVFSSYFITQDFDFNLSRPSRIPVFGRLLPLAVFLWACVVCDRLHFFCDRGILPGAVPFTPDFRELRVYRLLGIDVFMWAYGADVRTRAVSSAMGEPNACTDCDAPGRYCICDSGQAERNFTRLRKLTRAVFSGMAEMAPYVPGSINDLYYWPVDLDADNGNRYRPSYPQPKPGDRLKIVHGPNHAMFKGSRYLAQAVRELQEEGEPVDLILVERVPNAQALDLYRRADVIFDQCLIGGHGYFALEGLALGKPVMCFVRNPETDLLAHSECPIINTHVNTIKDDIRRLTSERHTLGDVGRRGREYVERNYSIEAFSRRLRKAYADLGVPV
jgi:glycosyltransferase involved in cell wall biosynthesis